MTLAGWGTTGQGRPARLRLLSDPAVAAPWRRDPAAAVIVSHKLLSSKHKSSSLGGTARTAASGHTRQRRTLAQHDPSDFESGRRGGVSDLGGGGQPTAEASAASASRSPLARTRNVARWVVRSGVLLFGLAAAKE